MLVHGQLQSSLQEVKSSLLLFLISSPALQGQSLCLEEDLDGEIFLHTPLTNMQMSELNEGV